MQGIVDTVNNPVIVSDPPFNVGYHYNEYKDNLSDSEYISRMKSIFSLCPAVIIHYPETLYKISIAMNKAPVKVVSWCYNANTPKQHRDIAFFDIKPDFKQLSQPYKNPNDKRIAQRINSGKQCALYDWWQISQVKNVSREKTAHPCQMPLQVMNNIIGILPKDITVIDPFMGAGTTGVACNENGIDFVGIEIDKRYFDISKERLAQKSLFDSEFKEASDGKK